MQTLLEIIKFGTFNCFIIGFLFLLNKKGNKLANKFYGILVLFLSAVVFENILIISKEILNWPHLFSTGAITMMLVPPFSYFLQKTLTDKGYKINNSSLILHGIPFFICLITMLPFYSTNASIKIEIIENVYYLQQPIKGHYVIYSVINIIQFITYNYLIIKSLKPKIKTQNKLSLKLNISWLHLLIILMNVLVMAYISLYISFIFTTHYQPVLVLIFMSMILLNIYVESYYLIRNPFFFNKNEGTYKRSTLKTDIAKGLNSKLNEIINKEKPYLNPNLKLNDLATLLEVSSHQLSQYINQSEESTFTQFINSYRINHAKQLLTEVEANPKTILVIAIESGFNNQPNFIKVFKNHTGITPHQYRETVKFS